MKLIYGIYTLVNGDVDGNGIVNVVDARIIMNFVLTGPKQTTTSYALRKPIDEFINLEIDATEDRPGTFAIEDNGIINIYDIIRILNDMSK